MVGIPEGIDTPDIMVELDVLQWNVDRMAAGLRARPAVMMRQTSPSVQLSGSVSEAVRARSRSRSWNSATRPLSRRRRKKAWTRSLLVTWNQAPQDASRILRRPHVLRRPVGQRGGAG
ncbi:hypothetical protein ACGF0D_35465, partial [Kitasatospora sp. NPDC048298]|uniref:hypothetical protein n=1 Tax=Kitasatospora sp. NPDC048298 TaxID=3364049 RepID=UPI0037113A0B